MVQPRISAPPQPAAGALPNLYSDVMRWVLRTPSAAALVMPQRTFSFHELHEQVAMRADLLARKGVAAGTRVAFVMASELEAAFVILATACLGATSVPFARSSTPQQRHGWIDDAEIAFMVSDHTVQGLDIRGLTSVLLGDSGCETLGEGDSMDVAAKSVGAALAVAPLMIITGSGSTGRAKLMALTHEQMRLRAQSIGRIVGISPADRVATMAHLEYAVGVHRLWAALTHGASFALLDRDSPSLYPSLKQTGVTVLSSTVFHAERLLANEAREGVRLLEGVRLTISGSVVSDELRQRVKAQLSNDVWVTYGTNESWNVTAAGPADLVAHPRTIGWPTFGVEVRVVDDGMRPVPDGKFGLIAIRSGQTIGRYLKDEEATARAFRGRWFLPGDTGMRLADGQIIFGGRSDNMMIFNGINIYPIEIEQCLMQHPAVADVVATPLRHDIHQDVPAAVVALHLGAVVTEAQLRAFAAARLGVRQPRRIFVCDTIPRNLQGKPVKQAIQTIIDRAMESSKPVAGARGANAGRFAVRFAWNGLSGQHLEPWLEVIAPQGLPQKLRDGYAADAKNVLQWVERSLRLAVALLHVLRQPVFDPIRVERCERDGVRAGQWIAICLLPERAVVAPALVAEVVGYAFRLTAEVRDWSPSNSQDRERFFSMIQNHVVARFADELPRGKSTFEILRQAHLLGIPFQRRSGDVFQLGWGCRSICLDRSVSMHDSHIGARVAANKQAGALWLRQAGLPTPDHRLVRDLKEAQSAARAIGFPVVVKPNDLERGEGVSVDVDPDKLAGAYELARRLSRSGQVLVEKQIHGVCHRLFVVHGRLLYGVRRLPLGVYGDGTSAVTELVSAREASQQAEPPWKRSGRFALDELALQEIARQCCTPATVPERGRFVALRRIETTAWGGVDEDITQQAHPENIKAAVAAAALLGLSVVGVDIISTDISQPWFANGAAINEVNHAPLLGGGEISRRHVGEFLARLISGGGRIPVHVFVGGECAWEAACKHQREWMASGLTSYVTSESLTLDAEGSVLHLACHGLGARVDAVLMRRDAACLAIVVMDAHVVIGPPPVDRITRIHWIQDDLRMSEADRAREFSGAGPSLRTALQAWWPDCIEVV